MAKMERSELKQRGIRIGVNQLVTWAGLIPVLWFVGQPILVKALAEDIKTVVQKEVSAKVDPINNAFVALLQRDINATKREIADLEYRARQEDWTQEEAKELANRKIDLAALEEAKRALEKKT